jgi:hypothetical protein
MTQQLSCGKGGHCDEGAQGIWEHLAYTGPGVP